MFVRPRLALPKLMAKIVATFVWHRHIPHHLSYASQQARVRPTSHLSRKLSAVVWNGCTVEEALSGVDMKGSSWMFCCVFVAWQHFDFDKHHHLICFYQYPNN